MSEKKRCLITGSTGMIGRVLLKKISNDDFNIRLLSRKKHEHYETIYCDFASDKIPRKALTNVHTIFHLAGLAHDFRNTNELNYLYRKINTDATINLAKRAVESGVKKFIYISSVKAGGSFISGKCMDESDQNDPEDVYGKTKREAEIKLLEIGRQCRMHISIIRSSLVYGPELKGNLQLMLLWIQKGWFPPLPETGNRRSMIHVDDLIRAILLVADNHNTNGEIYIATDGKNYSSREIYEVLCHVTKKPVYKWSVPKLFFDIISFIVPGVRYKIDKLLGDECYSSEKLQSIGFKARFSLKDLNETII